MTQRIFWRQPAHAVPELKMARDHYELVAGNEWCRRFYKAVSATVGFPADDFSGVPLKIAARSTPPIAVWADGLCVMPSASRTT
jgi:hypothetical protein